MLSLTEKGSIMTERGKETMKLLCQGPDLNN